MPYPIIWLQSAHGVNLPYSKILIQWLQEGSSGDPSMRRCVAILLAMIGTAENNDTSSGQRIHGQ